MLEAPAGMVAATRAMAEEVAMATRVAAVEEDTAMTEAAVVVTTEVVSQSRKGELHI